MTFEPMDQIDQRLVDACEQCGAVLELRAVAQQQWVAAMDDGSAIEFAWDADRQRLVLSVEIGRPPAAPAARLQILEALLSSNLLPDETGGVHAALGGHDGQVWLLADCTPAGDAMDWARVLSSLHEQATQWRRAIGTPATPEVTAAMPTPGMMA